MILKYDGNHLQEIAMLYPLIIETSYYKQHEKIHILIEIYITFL
jgi:hypothetical protein